MNHVPIIVYNYTSINYLEGKKHSSACIGVGSTAEVADSQWEMVEGISYMWDNAKCNLKEKISTMKQKQFDRYREWTDGY